MNEERLKAWKEKRLKRKEALRHEVLFEGIRKGDIQALSSGITLLESLKESDAFESQKLISECLPFSGQSIRVGITGVPGVGKSTFIESFGQLLLEEGYKVAVLAIDPSSEKHGGSILGDKTRMNQLSVQDHVFIRPSPSGSTLGGVAKKTRESIILCEAAGYDFILIETVGVGQSEIAVHSMVDFFMLLMLSGAGDELQGIKRGIMEMADALIITKADGDNRNKARLAKKEYENAIHLFPPNDNGWFTKTLTASAIEKYNLDKTLRIIEEFVALTQGNQSFYDKRKKQDKYWLHETISDSLISQFYTHPEIKSEIPIIEQAVFSGKISPFEGAQKLLKLYRERG